MKLRHLYLGSRCSLVGLVSLSSEEELCGAGAQTSKEEASAYWRWYSKKAQ